jgi:hypothetical protein
MKKLFLILLLFVSYYGHSQEIEFTFDSNKGMTDYVVSEFQNKTKIDLYTKTNEWIIKTFKNPKEIIQAYSENEFIRIEGVTKSFNGIHDAKYVIEISFKDGKYKFDPKSFIMIYGNNVFNLFETYSSYFKSDGVVKDRVKETIYSSTKLMNDLNKNLIDHINGVNETKNNNW